MGKEKTSKGGRVGIEVEMDEKTAQFFNGLPQGVQDLIMDNLGKAFMRAHAEHPEMDWAKIIENGDFTFVADDKKEKGGTTEWDKLISRHISLECETATIEGLCEAMEALLMGRRIDNEGEPTDPIPVNHTYTLLGAGLAKIKEHAENAKDISWEGLKEADGEHPRTENAAREV